MVGLKETWWRQETSNCVRIGHGGSGTQVVALKLTWLGGRQAAGLERAWWMWKTPSGCAQMDTAESEMCNQARKCLVEGETSG